MQISPYHTAISTDRFAEVLLPLAIPKPYTYAIPLELVNQVSPGKRVEVQFGKKKIYAGIILEFVSTPPNGQKPKSILSVIDDKPAVSTLQLNFWKWLAAYYVCTLGEVMAAALPAHLKLSSETWILRNPLLDEGTVLDGNDEFMIAEAMQNREEISIDDVQKILGKKSVYPVIQRLIDKNIILLKEELKKTYKPKKVSCLRLQEPYHSHPDRLEEAFDLLSRATRQVEALIAYIQLSKNNQNHIRKQEVYDLAKVDSTLLKAMEKKGIFEFYEHEVSRLGSYEDELLDIPELTTVQTNAFRQLKSQFATKNVCLLHGVTGSGKTRIYIELIKECHARGEQALYLLPEIALTDHLVSRLKHIFGDEVTLYHSRLGNNERTEIWKAVQEGKPLVMSARSGIFLPFKKLKLIIVDEEHDPSFKQFDPAPRYNARDAAIYLGMLTGAKVLLGTATPSLETYFNAQSNKFGLVELSTRFGGMAMPETSVADLRQERKKQSYFSTNLLQTIEKALEGNEQIILFQNRRGYAPSIHCPSCGWKQECINCDVSLTYHKGSGKMRCHYCSWQSPVPDTCPACGYQALHLLGFGTEKIEDELPIYFPHAIVARLDYDTAKGKYAHQKIINDFEEKRVQILVGTQMVTKGLDFDNVGVVGILSADQLLQFPDFRSNERAFQLMMQVAGRAGRKNNRGKVIIQTYTPDHPVIAEVLGNDYKKFYSREIQERQNFYYPPFSRLISVTLKHKKPEILNHSMQYFHHLLQASWKKHIVGPSMPLIPRVRNYFLLQLLIKLPKNNKLIAELKADLLLIAQKTIADEGCSGLRVGIDVDPY